jgi:hypothetical protein
MALKVVSEQSEANIRKQRVHDQLTRNLRKFAANFLRMTSGSGKPLDLLPQMEGLAASVRAYADAHEGALPAPKVIHQILDSHAAKLEHRPWIRDVEETARQRWEADGESDRSKAVAGIIRAGLRMVASELVDQLTQHSAAESDFYEQRRGQRKGPSEIPPKEEIKPWPYQFDFMYSPPMDCSASLTASWRDFAMAKMRCLNSRTQNRKSQT